jgi:hypothetical protein
MKQVLSLVAAVALAAVVPALACGEQAKAGCPFGKMTGVEKAIVNLDNGVKISWAAKDAALAKQVQHAVAEECAGGDCGKAVLQAKGVERKIENTADGVVVILTAANPELIKKVQDFGAEQKGDCKSKCPMSKTKGNHA